MRPLRAAALCILVVGAIAGPLRRLDAQDPVVIPGTVTVPGDAAQAVREVLGRSAGYTGSARYLAVTSFDCDGQTCYASVTGFRDPVDPAAWTFEQVTFVGSIALRRRASGGYIGMLDTEPGYAAFLADSPGARAQVLRASATQTETVAYDFPWQPGTSAVYGTLGVHKGGYIEGWKAVDFLSDANTTLNHAPNKLLAAAPGTISYVCDDGTNAAARIGDLIYVHLIGNPKLKVGQKIERGEELGQLKPGTYSTRCGYASQQPQNFHVHLAFPDTGSFTMGGWTLTLSDGIWRRSTAGGTQTWRVGQWLRNDALPPPATPTPAPTASPCVFAGSGDANCDSQIDGVDYALWLSSQCDSACGARAADFNRDGAVDDADYSIWLSNRLSTRVAVRSRTGIAADQRSVRLSVAPLTATAGVDLPLGAPVDFAIRAVFEPAASGAQTETLHYARVEIAVPGQVVSVTPGELDVSTSGLGRRIGMTSTVASASNDGVGGLITLELGAQTPELAPQTRQTVTIATFRVTTTQRSLGSWFMLFGAQFVSNDLRTWPIAYAAVPFAIDPNRVYLPSVRKR